MKENSKSKRQKIFKEAKIYKLLNTSLKHKQIGFPKLYCYGSEGDYNYLVMELLGPSLSELLAYCNGKFTLKTILLLADQIVDFIS